MNVTRMFALLLAGLVVLGSAVAKPPDLPLDLKTTCEAEESSTTTSPSDLETSEAVEQPVVSEDKGDGEAGRNDEEHPDTVERARMARKLYRIAERCRRSGDNAMAYSCYHEVHRLVPQTGLGRRALEWAQALEQYLRADEHAEPNAEEPWEQPLSESPPN